MNLHFSSQNPDVWTSYHFGKTCSLASSTLIVIKKSLQYICRYIIIANFLSINMWLHVLMCHNNPVDYSKRIINRS
jgi:hypothetical protein